MPEAIYLNEQEDAALESAWDRLSSAKKYAVRNRFKGDFVESDHPRAEDGKFGEGGGSAKPAREQTPRQQWESAHDAWEQQHEQALSEWTARDESRSERRATLESDLLADALPDSDSRGSAAYNAKMGTDTPKDNTQKQRKLSWVRANDFVTSEVSAVRGSCGNESELADELRSAGIPDEGIGKLDALAEKSAAAMQQAGAKVLSAVKARLNNLAAIEGLGPSPLRPENVPLLAGLSELTDEQQGAYDAWDEATDEWQEAFDSLDEKDTELTDAVDAATAEIDSLWDAHAERLETLLETITSDGIAALESEAEDDPEPEPEDEPEEPEEEPEPEEEEPEELDESDDEDEDEEYEDEEYEGGKLTLPGIIKQLRRRLKEQGHKPSGPGGGQFTSGGNGGGGNKPDKKPAAAESSDEALPPDLHLPEGLTKKPGMLARLTHMVRIAKSKLTAAVLAVDETVATSVIPNAYDHARNALLSTAVPGVPVNDIAVGLSKVLAWAWSKARSKAKAMAGDQVEKVLEFTAIMYEMLQLPEDTPLPSREEVEESLKKTTRTARLKGDFNEQDHPRADDGRFGDKPGSGGGGKPSQGSSDKPSQAGKPASDSGASSSDKPQRVVDVAAARAVPPHVEANGIDALSRATPVELAALKEYTGGDFATINSAMRKCPPDFKCVDGNSRKVMEAVESAIAKAKPFTEPATVYRGLIMRTDMANAMFSAAQDNLKSGKDFTMPSLTSTSTSPGKVVKDFTTSSGPAVTSVVFEIKAKTGLYVESITGVPGEKEVIQSAKTRYRVAAVEEVDFQMKAGPMRRTVIRLEEI